MSKIVCFGEILIDLLAQPPATPATPRAFLQYAGGAPANVAVAAARLGADTHFAGMLGQDMFGDFLAESLTSSETITPPVSSAVFQFNPKSFLLIFPSKENPALVCPHGSTLIPPKSTSNLTGFVTPFMVRFPVISSFKESVSKVITGLASALKKSADFRCVSRSVLLVLMEAVSIVARTFAFLKVSSSLSISTLKSLNSPLTLEIIMCLTLKVISLWVGSKFHFVDIIFLFIG